MIMSDLWIDVQQRLSDGQTPEYISVSMEIPIAWVYAVMEATEE